MAKALNLDSAFTDAIAQRQEAAPVSEVPPDVASQPTPESQPAPEIPPAAEPPAPAQPTFSAADYARMLGYEVPSTASEREVLEALHRESVRAQEQARYYAYQVQQGTQAKQPEQLPPSPEEVEDDYWTQRWTAPKFDMKWFDLLQTDPDSGRLVSKTSGGLPIVSPEVVQRANEYVEWYRTAPREFFENPYKKTFEAIREPLLDEVQRMVRETIENYQAQQKSKSVIEDYQRQYFKYLYQTDDSGNALVDRTGQPIFTAYGSRINDVLTEMKRSGITDDAQCLAYATRIVNGEFAAQAQSAPEAPAETTPAETPAVATPAAAPPASFIQKAAARTTNVPESGYAQPYPGDSNKLSEMELETMFTRAANKRSA